LAENDAGLALIARDESGVLNELWQIDLIGGKVSNLWDKLDSVAPISIEQKTEREGGRGWSLMMFQSGNLHN
jgi:hypothetical protein